LNKSRLKKKEKDINYYKLIFSITLFIILIDQLTKFLIRSTLSINQTKTLIPKVLELTFIKNTGIAFGLLKNLQPIMITITILIIAIIIYYLKDIKDRNLAITISLILGGAFGNLVDRIFYGAITDFIKISIWPVFNVADACISVGAILLIIYFLKKDSKKANKNKNYNHKLN